MIEWIIESRGNTDHLIGCSEYDARVCVSIIKGERTVFSGIAISSKAESKASQWCQFKHEYNMISKMVYWLLVFLGRKVDVGHKPRLYKILSNVKIKCWCQYRNKLRIDSLLCLELTPCFKPNSFLKNGPILASFSVYFRLFNMSKLKLLKV